MNAVTESNLESQIPTVVGTPFEGGFYAGTFSIDEDVYLLILSPKAHGRHDRTVWGKYGQDVEGARSFCDGLANTRAMAEAGSEIAKWALGLNINGFSDWYLPARDEVEMLYRAFKPTAEENDTYRHGENPSSLPVGYPYTAEFPTQTSVEAFQEDGPEAFEESWYWSSTHYSAGLAWTQHFVGGNQYAYGKDDHHRSVAVRRLKLQ